MTDPRGKTESELVQLIRAVDVTAPESLHRSVDALVNSRTRGRRGSRRAPVPARWPQRLAALGGLAAAIAAVLVVALSSGGGSGLTVQRASALALARPTQPAPEESKSHRDQLQVAVDGVAFPYWEGAHLGWKATGTRSDRVGGRTVTTVFYEGSGGRRLGYAIAGGTAPVRTSGGSVSWRGGTSYRLLRAGASRIVTWTRDGHLCVIAARGVSAGTLLHLASWGNPA
jgi:hypothetical protein